MLRRQLAGLLAATTTALTLVCAFSLGVAGPQEKAKSQPPAGGTPRDQEKGVPQPPNRQAEKRRAQISKLLADYDLTPHPLPPITDDPPPHEGAMISLPHLVEPPDLIIVEVLEALPGRPISGERLVKPDGTMTITIDLDGQNLPKVENRDPAGGPQGGPNPFDRDDGNWTVVPPAESGTVFVDITAYNSKNFYVIGDVQIAGKLPWTGNETVLDAIQYAGGLLSSAEPKEIRLVRPGRGGKPAKVYKVDLAAIQEKGDVKSNYQIFPNDRLIVGRNEVIKKTVEIDRLNAPIQSITSYMLQEAFVLRYLQFVTTDNREELLKELVDFWAKEVSRPDGVKFDEQTLRDAILRKLKLAPAPLQPAPAPR